MLVYFLRHANAGQKKLKNDEKRPLDKEGIEQSGNIGRLLSALDIHPDLVISSPLKRALQTASLVGNELGYEDKIQIEPALRPSASFDAFRELLRNCAKLESIIVVGHDPNFSRFLSLLISNGSNDQIVDMKKGSVARVDYSSKRSTLDWMITPKIAKAAYSIASANSRPKSSRK
jgi:phosphohistidine phosphatase